MKRSTPDNVIYLTFPKFNFELFLMRAVVAMIQADLSYYDIAHRTNLGLSTICRIMSRRSKNMYVGTAAKIAKALGVSADYLLDIRPARTKRECIIEEETQENLKMEQRRAAK